MDLTVAGAFSARGVSRSALLLVATGVLQARLAGRSPGIANGDEATSAVGTHRVWNVALTPERRTDGGEAILTTRSTDAISMSSNRTGAARRSCYRMLGDLGRAET